MWSLRRASLARLAALALLAAASGCAGVSASRTLLRESDPVVRRYEETRARLRARDAAEGLAARGGCPVCQW